MSDHFVKFQEFQCWRLKIWVSLEQFFSTFLLQRNPKQAWRSLTEPHALIHVSSDVREVEARLISLAGQSPHSDDKAGRNEQL